MTYTKPGSSAELIELHRAMIISRAYKLIFQRSPSSDEESNWTQYLSSGGSIGFLVGELRQCVTAANSKAASFHSPPSDPRLQVSNEIDPAIVEGLSSGAKALYRKIKNPRQGK